MKLAALRTGMLFASLLIAQTALSSEGTLSGDQRISSSALGYDLQYRVYRPAATAEGDKLPSLYVTDGQMYLEYGQFKSVLDDAIGAGLIRPVLVVFLDSRNPDSLQESRRDTEFMCNSKFAAFFSGELIPAISNSQPVSHKREDRVILGLSFGGLNSACFGLTLSDLFAGIAMQSPASDLHVDVVREQYEKSPTLPIRFFLSVGTRNDNLAAVNRLRRVLDAKEYEVVFKKVRQGHDWQNWGPLLDDVLLTFYSSGN